MQFAVPLPRIEQRAGRRTTYLPRYTDEQLTALGEGVKDKLGEAFVSFAALDGEATHDITIEWIDVAPVDEVAAIDAAFAEWTATVAQVAQGAG